MLKDLRKEAGFSQRKLASESGVHYRTIQDWEKFGIERAKIGQAVKVCRVLGCKLDDLLGE